ncbi:unnamed protein product, partial [Allacma fusca]
VIQTSIVKCVDYDSNEHRFIKLHGVFMILAWLALIPNAVFISRYIKESYRQILLFGQPIWKVAHVGLISLAGLFVFVGMVMIWSHLTAIKVTTHYFGKEYIHMGVGYTVCVLFGIQLIVGIFRGLSDFQNFSMNILHFLLGTIAYILALVLIGRAHIITTSLYHCYDDLLIIVWVIWEILWHVIISIHYFFQDRHMRIISWRALLPMPFPVLTTTKIM